MDGIAVNGQGLSKSFTRVKISENYFLMDSFIEGVIEGLSTGFGIL